MSIELKTGDPLSGPATFSRFALPFRYAVEPVSASDDSPSFRETDPDDLPARRKYFTPETAEALFGRARWHALVDERGQRPAPIPIKLDVGDCAGTRLLIDASLRPSVVLFEAESAFQGGRDQHAVLHTGFLMLDLSFPKEQKVFLDELLLINEYFRYWREPFDGHATNPCHYTCDGSDRIATYSAFAAGLRFPGNADDLYTERWTHFLADIPFISSNGESYRVVSLRWKEDARRWIERGEGDGGWIASTDERAFVWSCALTAHGSNDFLPPADVTHSAAWIRLLNVDRPAASEASPFEKSWADARTYTRWAHFGTLYGFNEHSGVLVAKQDERLPLWRHFMGIYFDQELLLLYLR
jgi:hypothetical protein